jgi:metal transporter CNNM
MWISAIISWPIAQLLDYFSGGPHEDLVFSNDELAGLIKYHEKSQNHRGSLGQDASRLMIGALRLDNQNIGAVFATFPQPAGNNSLDKDSSDIEKADAFVSPGFIRGWTSVKTVDIDDIVDRELIKKVASWSYSHIPVVGEAEVELTEPGMDDANKISWASKKVFGFLHIKVRATCLPVERFGPGSTLEEFTGFNDL